MFYRIRRSIANTQFKYRTRRLLNTLPLNQTDGPVTFVSMVGNADVHLYILAIKSIYARIGSGRITTLIARDFPAGSMRLITRHLGSVEFIFTDTIDTGPCQRGGCWERLCYCIELSQSRYVIQLDTDVLATEAIEEVSACIQENRSFILSDGTPRLTMLKAAEQVQNINKTHIQITAEKSFVSYPGGTSLLYQRGSAGFAGFARGACDRHGVERFHRNMVRILGNRWREWGTEQVASNFVLANSQACRSLPYPKYFTYEGRDLGGALYHFIGSHRFQNGLFVDKANAVITDLLSASGPR
jgi:hypothetical protein